MATRLWVKQYGLERSGTNFAKALLEMSCPDVRVLATVLGSKHYPPDLEAHVAMLEQGDVGIAITDLQASDFPDIIDAYRQRRMGVLLCVRDAVTWAASVGLRTTWAVHHRVVREPQELLDTITTWGARCGPAVEVGYLRKAGDRHGSENVTGRPYRPRQYRSIYSGEGQIRAEDVDWLCGLVEGLDNRGIARDFLWDRRPLRRRET